MAKGENDIKFIKEYIESDSYFLRKCGLLDYSILLAVEYKSDGS